MKHIFKYLIVDTGAIIFSEATVHSMVGKGFKKIYSAGFCSVEFIDVKISPTIKCHGHSESLNLDSQPEIDQIIIGDLFAKISKIKYFGMSVKEFYKP